MKFFFLLIALAQAREWYAYQYVFPNHNYTQLRSDCFDQCLHEWKIAHYGGRPFPALGCANQCDQKHERFESELVREEQEYIRRYGKEYSPVQDGVPLEMRKIENRLQSFFREIESQGGDNRRAFLRFDADSDSVITYAEYRAMIEHWNPQVIEQDFVYVVFYAGDTNLDGSLDYTEFLDFYDVLNQYDTTTLVTVYARPKMLTRERFGIVIEEVYY